MEKVSIADQTSRPETARQHLFGLLPGERADRQAEEGKYRQYVAQAVLLGGERTDEE